MAEEYNLPLGFDIDDIIKKSNKVLSILEELNRGYEKFGKTASATFNKASQDAEKFNSTIKEQSTSYHKNAQEVENMKDALSDLKKMAFGNDVDVKKLQFYRQEINKLEKDIEKAGRAGTEGFDKFGNKLKEVKAQGDSFLGSLKSIAGAIGITFGVNELINFGKELFKIGVQADGIGRAFARIGDSKSLEKLRKETQGFVSDLDLERLTVKANNFNIPMEKLGTFLLFASQRAKDTGEDVNKLTDNIIDGLGRKSSRIIDNLGISIVDIQKEFRRTGDFTTAVSNLIEKEMQASGTYVDTLSDKVNRNASRWENLKTTVGSFFTSLFSPDNPDNKKIGELTQLGLKQVQDFSNKSAEERNKSILDQEKKIANLSKVYTDASKKVEGLTLGIFSLSPEQDRNAKRIASEKLIAEQNILAKMVEQNTVIKENLRTQKNILSIEELRAKKANLVNEANNIIPLTPADSAREKALLKQAEDVQKEIDERTGKAQKKRDKLDDTTEAKRIARMQALNDEKVRLTNLYYSAQLDAIEEGETKAVATETVNSQSRVREYENSIKKYPELTKQYNELIEEEQRQSGERVNLIIKKSEEEQLKVRKSSFDEISRALKNDTIAQINASDEKFRLIIQNARKAGTLTAQVEKQLLKQNEKEKQQILLAESSKLIDMQEEIALSGIFTRKRKEGQSEKRFERENQIDLLKIAIEFAQRRLALIATDPEKIKDANQLNKAIQDAQNSLSKLTKKNDVGLLEGLGIDEEKLKAVTDGISSFGELASDIFGGLAERQEKKVNAIQLEIDKIDELISKQEEQVNKEKDLMDKGFANNYANAVKELNFQKAQREKLVKDEEQAQKKLRDLQRAQLVADTISQTSNLITASTEIFKTFSKIPIIGIPLGIAAIAAMFGGFAIAKANAFNATKLAEGGTIGGKSHAEGGNKYVSMDGNSFMEHERGEEVTKRSSAEKHRKLLKAINEDDFSSLNMNDISIREMMNELGLTSQMEISKIASQKNVKLVEKSRLIGNNKGGNSEKYLKSIDERVGRMEENQSSKLQILDFGDYYLIIDGHYKQKIWK